MTDADAALALLVPPAEMEPNAVSRMVGNDGPELIEPIPLSD